jgi:hypothetical protein
MPLQSIIVVVVRILSFQWFVRVIMQLPILFTTLRLVAKSGTHTDWSTPITIIMVLMVSSACWIFSPWIAQLLVKGHDASINLSNITLSNLYCFAFVWIGLSFSLAGLRGICANAYEVLDGLNHTASSIVPLSKLARSIASLLIGVLPIIFSVNWSKKLAVRAQ